MSDADGTPTSIAPAGCNIPGEDQPMLNEFREFIAKGNVMDLAVGVIIGAAFQKIVDSLVNDVVMPVVGLATGGTDFSNMFTVMRDGAKAAGPYASLAEAKAAGATVIAYGAFVTQVIQFLILAWVVFLMVKAVNRMRRNQPPVAVKP
jgi:large conductance mechanosensitive channel